MKVLLIAVAIMLLANVAYADFAFNGGYQSFFKFNQDGTATTGGVPLGFMYRPEVVDKETKTAKLSRVPIFLAYDYSKDNPDVVWAGAGWSFGQWEGYELIAEFDALLEDRGDVTAVGFMTGMRGLATIGGQGFLVRCLGGWLPDTNGCMSISIGFTTESAEKETIDEWK